MTGVPQAQAAYKVWPIIDSPLRAFHTAVRGDHLPAEIPDAPAAVGRNRLELVENVPYMLLTPTRLSSPGGNRRRSRLLPLRWN
jgi:hypothetical protein